MTQLLSSSSLRRLYLAWVEEQIEDYKDSVPRSELLQIAEQVVAELDVSRSGQYQLTEILLLEEVDRRIFRLLKLPGYRGWSAQYLDSLRDGEGSRVEPEPAPEPEPATYGDVLRVSLASL